MQRNAYVLDVALWLYTLSVLDILEMFFKKECQSVIELVLHQLIPLSVASATLLTIVGTFLVAKVLQPFISDFERTYYSDRLYEKGSNESVIISFVNVQEGMKVIVEESSASQACHGIWIQVL